MGEEFIMISGIKTGEFPERSYGRIYSFGEWRIAATKYWEGNLIENRKIIERHNETDEVFILLEGSAVLYTAGNADEPGEFEFVKMEPFKAYGVQKGYWHAHALAENATVLIVENENTSRENSDHWFITDEKRSELRKKYDEFMKAGGGE